MEGTDTTEILYDGQCPLCSGYCRKIEMKEGAPPVLLDAREKGALLDEITRLGLDIDEGMVVKRDGKIFYGSEAMREIVRLKKSGRLERLIYSTKQGAKIAYAASKTLRNALLWLLAVDKIRNLEN
jgi:predicted DCC family thiol-disulfide oxidoreductase YuxK